MPGTPDQQLATLRAGRTSAITEDISFVYVVKSRFEGDSPCAVKSLWRRPRLVLQLEIGMERREVQGHVGPKMRQYPFGKLASFRGVVVQRRNDQICNFKPDLCFLLQPLEGFQHGFQMRQSNLSVETFRESL